MSTKPFADLRRRMDASGTRARIYAETGGQGARLPNTVHPWIEDALKIGMNPHGMPLRCPGCDALVAYHFQGYAAKRCWRCRENYEIIWITNIIQLYRPANKIYGDEARAVHCPLCGAPLMEDLVGVYTITCFYCKWGGIIHRNAVSLIQSHHSLVEPKWKDTVWQPGKPASEQDLRANRPLGPPDP